MTAAPDPAAREPRDLTALSDTPLERFARPRSLDGVGPEVIPSVAQIRRKFTERRKGVGALDRRLRRLLGLDQKMAQYRDGGVLCHERVSRGRGRPTAWGRGSRPCWAGCPARPTRR